MLVTTVLVIGQLIWGDSWGWFLSLQTVLDRSELEVGTHQKGGGCSEAGAGLAQWPESGKSWGNEGLVSSQCLRTQRWRRRQAGRLAGWEGVDGDKLPNH